MSIENGEILTQIITHFNIDATHLQTLRSLLSQVGVESVGGIQALADLLSTKGQGVDDGEEGYPVSISVGHIPAVRELIHKGLRNEFAYIEGLCTNGFAEQGLARLDGEYGPHRLISLLSAIPPVNIEDPSATAVSTNWS